MLLATCRPPEHTNPAAFAAQLPDETEELRRLAAKGTLVGGSTMSTPGAILLLDTDARSAQEALEG